MTHFTVALLVPQFVADIPAFIERQMHRFSEHLDVPPYVCYSPQEAGVEIADSIHRLELIISRKEPHYDLDKCRQEIEELRRTTPEDRYRERLKLYERFNDQGEPLSTYNPDSKWDWYVIGGRWDGWLNDIETGSERVEDNTATTRQGIDRGKIPHAIVTPDGAWHERGRMGWWAILLTENENWDDQARAIFECHSDCRVVIVDAHI